MFIAFWMTQQLTREIHDLQKKVMDKQIELTNYQNYAGILGGSSILTMGNVSGLSSKLLPRASTFAQYSDQASSLSAMNNLQMMKMMGRVPYTGNPMTQMQVEMSAFKNFKEAALKELKRRETEVLNRKEKEIQLELNSIQQQLTMKEKQLESYKNLAKEQAQQSAPQF